MSEKSLKWNFYFLNCFYDSHEVYMTNYIDPCDLCFDIHLLPPILIEIYLNAWKNNDLYNIRNKVGNIGIVAYNKTEIKWLYIFEGFQRMGIGSSVVKFITKNNKYLVLRTNSSMKFWEKNKSNLLFIQP